MSHRRIKPAYVWGALSNTEPPDDDEDVIGYYGSDDCIEPAPCYVCGAAHDDMCQGRDGQLAECPR